MSNDGLGVSPSRGAFVGEAFGEVVDHCDSDHAGGVVGAGLAVAYGAAVVHEPAQGGESAWGAAAGFPRLRFPRPLTEPDVRLSPHPALHEFPVGSMFNVAHGVAMFSPRQR